MRHENVLFLRNFCELAHIRSAHPKWTHSITAIPTNLP